MRCSGGCQFFWRVLLQAVEAICGDLLDTIEHLVDKSLVIVEQLSDERLRYRLLETLRHYAAEHLVEADEEEDARERHFTYYLDVAERTYARRIEDEAASLALLDGDHDDFRAALRWARARPRYLLRLTAALGWFWHLRSDYREGRAWLEEALSVNANDRSPDTALALWALSMILSWSGDVGARRLADRSLELWQENGEPLELALALESIGYSQFMAGEYADALRSMEDCLEQYRKFGSAKLVTRGRVNVGQMLVALGDVERTEPLARETLAEGQTQNEPKSIHYSLHYLGDCASWRGEPQKAVGIYGASLRAALDYGNQMEASTEMQGMAMGLAGSGKEEEALRLYGASCARNEECRPLRSMRSLFGCSSRKRYLTHARERLGSAAAERAERKGVQWDGRKLSRTLFNWPKKVTDDFQLLIFDY